MYEKKNSVKSIWQKNVYQYMYKIVLAFDLKKTKLY